MSNNKRKYTPSTCVLKCKNTGRLFNFPEKIIMRNVWLFRFGLDLESFYPNLQACDRHFSSKMFSQPDKLKSYAVPDLNIPVDITADGGTTDKTTSAKNKAAPKQGKVEFNTTTRSQAKVGQKPIVPYSNTKLTKPVKTIVVPDKEPESPVKPWINDTSSLLVDYQLKVRGKHLCDVIEIPQYIVVFTVVRDKQKKIKLIENKKPTNGQSVGDTVKIKEPQFLETITIDDDDEASNLAAVSGKPEPLKMSKVLPSQRSATNIPNVIEPKAVPLPPSELPHFVKPKKQPEPLTEIVYYTTEDDVPPRRDRSIQVDLTSKHTLGIQCDFALDYDLMHMHSNSKIGDLQFTMDECLVCGEIVDSPAAKIKHAREHEEIPSLCWQCGGLFNSRSTLRAHNKSVHANEVSSQKLQRCPKRYCKKAFRSKALLDIHIREHIRTRGHKCARCLQVFNSPMKLICHQRALDKCLRNRGWTSKRWIKRI